jgi:glycosyltransferase A (GT-A) superfamily protein (DUF2064 family)
MPHARTRGVRSKLYSVVSHPALLVCAAVCIGAACPDLDHLLPGAARTTHYALAVLAWVCVGGYVALVCGRSRAGVLRGDA